MREFQVCRMRGDARILHRIIEGKAPEAITIAVELEAFVNDVISRMQHPVWIMTRSGAHQELAKALHAAIADMKDSSRYRPGA